jgi:hypothetical protein
MLALSGVLSVFPRHSSVPPTGVLSIHLRREAKARDYRSIRSLKAMVYLLAGKLDLCLPA